MSDPLIIAVPSKGRLKEKTEEIFEKSGFPILSPFGARNYKGAVDGYPEIEIAFLSASEIARELARGTVHLGITGEDLIKENIPHYDLMTAQLQPLHFGHADVVVAVPESWIDVTSMEDLDDVAAGFRARHGRRLRVATKYWNLTQRFFSGYGIALYRIVESLGATEGAPAAGLADIIVDITSTGSTLTANHLKTLEDSVILRSQANLFSSRKARWSDATIQLTVQLLKKLEQHLASEEDEKERGIGNRFLEQSVPVQQRFLNSLRNH